MAMKDLLHDTEDLHSGDSVSLSQFERFVEGIISENLHASCLTPPELNLLLDIQGCFIPHGEKSILARYKRAAQLYGAEHPGEMLKLSQFIGSRGRSRRKNRDEVESE